MNKGFKILLKLLIILLLSLILFQWTSTIFKPHTMDAETFGYPWNYKGKQTWCPYPNEVTCGIWQYEYTLLALDVMFWYIVTFLGYSTIQMIFSRIVNKLIKPKFFAIALFITLSLTVFALGVKYQNQLRASKNISTKQTSVFEPAMLPTTQMTTNWKQYSDPKNRFSFKYPQNYFPYILSNGNVLFFGHQQDMENCQNNRYINGSNACLLAPFTLSGFRKMSSNEYKLFLKKTPKAVATKTFIDIQGREWLTKIDFGEVYNYTAIYEHNDIYYAIYFQERPHMLSIPFTQVFFESILSNLEIK